MITIIVGVVCFIVGGNIGFLLAAALCVAKKTRSEIFVASEESAESAMSRG